MIHRYAPLPEKTEWLMGQIVDGGLCVHKEIGGGFFEKIYKNALCIELRARGIPFEVEKSFVIRYRSQPVGMQRIDLIVDEAVIVEIKAVEGLAKPHEQQLLSYLKATRLRAGLLMNFGGLTLKQGLRRFVL